MKKHQLPLLLAIATGLASILTPISAHAGAYPFAATGSFVDGGRYGHPAVRLADGRVFVVGGDQATGQTASAETYNPSSGNWSLSGPMSTQRDNHTANLLPDGRVLVAGGAYIVVFASTEIWDPTTGEFTPGLPMNVARYYHRSVGLSDGRILVAGGYGVGGFALDSAEIYDPATGTWTPTGPMATSRVVFAAVLLADGRILITGGSKGPEGGHVSISNCEIFNPSTGTFTPVAPMSKARNYHAAALLADGRVLVAGGSQNIGPIYYNDAEIYDPSANAWTPAGSLTAGGNGVSLTRLSDGHVLAAGGLLFYSGAATNAADLFDPVTSTFSPLAPMNVVRGYHSATLLGDGSVLLAGGADFSVSPSAISSAERFILSPVLTSLVVTPANSIIGLGANQQFTATGTFSDGSSRTLTAGGGVWAAKASMPGPRATMALGVVSGILYAAGGFTGTATTSAVDTFEAYDPVANTWTSKAAMPTVRHQAGAAAVNGILYVIGGFNACCSQQLGVVEAYDPASNTWSTKSPMPTARGAFAIGVVNNVIYAVGGLSFEGGGHTIATVEAYDPESDSWTTKAAMPTSRYIVAGGVVNNILYAVGGSLGDGTPLTTVEAYDPASNTWSAKAPLPAAHNSYGIGTINGILYLASGNNGVVIDPTVLAYDPAANVWSAKASITTPRNNLGGAVVNGVLYAVGGQNSGGVPVTTVEAFTPPEVTWSSGTPAVATINSNALAAGLSVGSSLITASAGDLSANTTLTVVTPPDTTPPVIVCPSGIAVPCSVDLLVPVAFSVTATDDSDPSPTVICAPPSGSLFPIGQTTVNCTATDASGNHSTCTFTVTRAPLGFAGFLSPIGGADATGGSFASPVRTFKMGSTIPVKFTASCGGSAVLTGVHRLQAVKYSDSTSAGTPIDATPQDAATTGNQFRLADGQWHFNLDTKGTGMSAGIWLLRATLSDGSQHSVWIQVK